MKRGEIWWAELAGAAGFRPVTIVSRADAVASRTNIIIAEVTRTVRNLPCEVPPSTADGMPTRCVINTDNLHTIPRNQLRASITSLFETNEFALDRALKYSLGLDW